jgi:hypothetical protein
VPYEKHRPIPGKSWIENIAATAGARAPARYHPDVVPHIRKLEVDCVEHGTEILSHPHPRIRAFYAKVDTKIGVPVGASKGEETEYIFVTWEDTGEIHGRPMTRDQLIHEKGVEDP